MTIQVFVEGEYCGCFLCPLCNSWMIIECDYYDTEQFMYMWCNSCFVSMFAIRNSEVEASKEELPNDIKEYKYNGLYEYMKDCDNIAKVDLIKILNVKDMAMYGYKAQNKIPNEMIPKIIPYFLDGIDYIGSHIRDYKYCAPFQIITRIPKLPHIKENDKKRKLFNKEYSAFLDNTLNLLGIYYDDDVYMCNDMCYKTTDKLDANTIGWINLSYEVNDYIFRASKDIVPESMGDGTVYYRVLDEKTNTIYHTSTWAD